MNRLVAALVVLVLASLAWAGYATRAKSKAEGRAILADSVAEAAGRRADAKATVFFHDTTRVMRSVRTTDTLLSRIIDTAIVHHSDTVTVRVPILVAIRDTIRACSALVVTCGEALEASRTEVAALKVADAAWRKAAHAGKLWGIPMPRVVLGYGAVLDVTTLRLATGPAATVGWTISF